MSYTVFKLLNLPKYTLCLYSETFCKSREVLYFYAVIFGFFSGFLLCHFHLSDAIHSGIFDVLVESCPTKILLPNEEADKAGTDNHLGPRDLYTVMGLNSTQIQMIKTAVKKREYYYLSPEGRRLFELNLGPVALAFTAVSDKKTLAHLQELQARHGADWPFIWLEERGIAYEALLA